MMVTSRAPLSGSAVTPGHRASPLTGVVLGLAMSLLLWAIIVAAVLVIR